MGSSIGFVLGVGVGLVLAMIVYVLLNDDRRP